jgi:hypothetical protein
MTDTILKQNAGRGGAVIVNGTSQAIPAGEYSHFYVLAPIQFVVLPTAAEMPRLTGLTTSVIFDYGTTLNTPLVIGASSPARVTGTAIFYKAIID